VGARAAGGRAMNGRLLVVEQNALFAIGLELALSRMCWDVETNSAPSALDVVDHARRFRPGCILFDAHFGHDVDGGVDLVKRLATTGAHVVMLTAERRRSVLAECIEAGAVGWIGRDATLEDVEATLGRIVAGEPIIGP
jgi:DNA-binding NarL/FixJ family response regulator